MRDREGEKERKTNAEMKREWGRETGFNKNVQQCFPLGFHCVCMSALATAHSVKVISCMVLGFYWLYVAIRATYIRK